MAPPWKKHKSDKRDYRNRNVKRNRYDLRRRPPPPIQYNFVPSFTPEIGYDFDYCRYQEDIPSWRDVGAMEWCPTSDEMMPISRGDCEKQWSTKVDEYLSMKAPIDANKLAQLQQCCDSNKGAPALGINMLFMNDVTYNMEEISFSNFLCKLNVLGRIFEGNGSSKNIAKGQASRNALLTLLADKTINSLHNPAVSKATKRKKKRKKEESGGETGVLGSFQPGNNQMEQTSTLSEQLKSIDLTLETPMQISPQPELFQSVFPPADTELLSMHLGDIVAKLVIDKCSEIPHAPASVYAGVVCMENGDINMARTLVACAGSKSIDPKYDTKSGERLLDCHAEILACRSLRAFLFEELNKTACASGRSLLCKNSSNGLYRVKPGISLYLYVSSAPCGDCRTFSRSQNKQDNSEYTDNHPNRQSRGHLRFKKDGTNVGALCKDIPKNCKELLSMVCSDKLMKRNALGVQGALLSKFMEPVYLTGLVIGDFTSESHVRRATCGRVDKLDLPLPYHTNMGLKIMLTHLKPPNMGKCSNKQGLNWIFGKVYSERVNVRTGLTGNDTPSRLCKAHFMRYYVDCLNNVEMADGEGKRLPYNFQTYMAAKMDAKGYGVAKEAFVNYFARTRYGEWTKCKNKQCDSFYISVVRTQNGTDAVAGQHVLNI